MAKWEGSVRCLQAFNADMYGRWMGYERLEDVVLTVTPEEAADVFGPVGIGEYRAIVSPNVQREARLHFNCPEMEGALLEQELFQLTDSWSMRHYHVRSNPPIA